MSKNVLEDFQKFDLIKKLGKTAENYMAMWHLYTVISRLLNPSLPSTNVFFM